MNICFRQGRGSRFDPERSGLWKFSAVLGPSNLPMPGSQQSTLNAFCMSSCQTVIYFMPSSGGEPITHVSLLKHSNIQGKPDLILRMTRKDISEYLSNTYFFAFEFLENICHLLPWMGLSLKRTIFSSSEIKSGIARKKAVSCLEAPLNIRDFSLYYLRLRRRLLVLSSSASASASDLSLKSSLKREIFT